MILSFNYYLFLNMNIFALTEENLIKFKYDNNIFI